MVGFEGTVGLLQSPVSYTLKKTPRNEDEFLDLHSCVTPPWLWCFTPSPSLRQPTITYKEETRARPWSFAVLLGGCCLPGRYRRLAHSHDSDAVADAHLRVQLGGQAISSQLQFPLKLTLLDR